MPRRGPRRESYQDLDGDNPSPLHRPMLSEDGKLELLAIVIVPLASPLPRGHREGEVILFEPPPRSFCTELRIS